jgi:hypothetical protein
MSTTVKPLNIYIGDTKVFPDVDLSPINDAFYQNEAILGVKEASDTFLEETRCDIAHTMEGKIFICEQFNDGDKLNGRHTHNNLQDYWLFVGDDRPTAPVILDIDFNINPKWLINSVGTTYDSACKNLKYVKSLNFKSDKKLRPAQGYDINDHSTLLFSYFSLNNLFENCYNVEEINGLDLTDTQSFINTIDPSNDNTLAYNPTTDSNHWFSEYQNGGLNGNCAYTFSGCMNLHTLNITWPNTLYTTSTNGMFLNCESLPDNQIPTFDLRPIYIPYTVADGGGNTYLGSPTLDINNMFRYCRLVSSTHLSAASWAYIREASATWADTSVHSIDIPDTATNLINVAGILGDSVTGEDDGQGGTDYSNCKYIIRTTAPMTAKLNGVDGVDCRLFDFWNYENQDFYDTFGGIYVPDAQLTDWQNMIANEYGASNVAANCVHGLSDLQ